MTSFNLGGIEGLLTKALIIVPIGIFISLIPFEGITALTTPLAWIAAVVVFIYFLLQSRDYEVSDPKKAAWWFAVVIMLSIIAAGAFGIPGLAEVGQSMSILGGALSFVGYVAAATAAGLFVKTLVGLTRGG